MRIAVITCEAYQDAWKPFLALFQKFWPDCPYPMTFHVGRGPEQWCGVVVNCAKESGDDPILMLLEDFFLTQPVQHGLIKYALKQMQDQHAVCARLYPGPGGTDEYGDPYMATVPRGTGYRISTQAAIWDPHYLAELATYVREESTAEARDFETCGTPHSNIMHGEIIGWKREQSPYPITYLVTAITKGEWEPATKNFCDAQGIEVDYSRRPFRSII